MSDWTDEKVAKLRELHAQGLSMSIMGERLGVSKNSVIGKATRLGLVRTAEATTRAREVSGARTSRKLRPAPKVKPAPKPKLVEPKPAIKFSGNGATFAEPADPRAPLVAPPKAHAFQPLPGSTPRLWEAWEVGLCRWPIDSTRVSPLEGDPTRACCLPAYREGNTIFSYCGAHMIASGAGRTASQPRTEAQKAGDIARAEKARSRMARRLAA